MINNPKFRFNTFRNQWRTIKLGKVFKQTTNYVNPKLQNIELWSLTVEKGLTPKTDRYNRSFLVKKENQFKAVSDGEFIYNPMNITLGAIDLNNTGNQVAVSGYYVTMKIMNDFDKNYFNVWLKLPLAINLYKSFATGSLIEKQRVQFPTFSLVSAAVPGIDEQKKIGKFFSDLEETISLHQQELDAFKQAKQGFLQKMFPSKGQSVPEIRFKEFKNMWSYCKLNEISEKVKEKNVDNAYSETLTNSAEFGIINQRDFFDKDISNKLNLYTYYVVQPDDFVYNPRISKLAPVGPIKRNKLGRAGVMSPLYYVFRIRNLDLTYLEYYFSTEKWHMFMKLNGDSGARSDRISIKDSIFSEMPIPLPSIEEQFKIGEFFKRLDEMIDLKEQELEALKQTKKGFLQKMFV